MYLNPDKLQHLDEAAFQTAHPFPWTNPADLLTESGYRELKDNLPALSLFRSVFGKPRKYGQRSHDRYALEWQPDLALPGPWRDFIEELRGPGYRAFLRRMIGHDRFDLHFHWHYTPTGCSVSPHCDAAWKLGSHIFYFNTEHDWAPEWGGETLVLDDDGRFSPKSAPDFGDFDRVYATESLGNRSLLFVRSGNSWHGVKPVRCPQDRLRKVFIVVINRSGPWYRLRRRLRV